VSGNTTTSGGAANAITGGKEIPMLMSTAAVAGTVEKLISRKNMAPKTSFFILCSPFSGVYGSSVRRDGSLIANGAPGQPYSFSHNITHYIIKCH
jgi:hypothetical protein